MRTNTQVSDMRIWHVDTSARLSAKAAHEMQTFLHELRKLKKCQRTLDTNVNTGTLAFRYREDGVYKSVCLKDVVYFVGAGKGVEVHCKDGRVAFAGNSLQQLCDIYEKHGFSRCHKSYLINLNYVSEYSMSKVKMSDGKEIIIGKSRRKQFKDEFINHELMED